MREEERLALNGKSLVLEEAYFPELGNIKVLNMPLMQSIVVFGLPGVKRNDPDYYSAYVMNYILGGGGFISRLTREIREKRGLVYSVYSYLSPLQHTGLLIGGFATRNDAVFKTLDILKYEISLMASEGVSEAELLAAKQYLTGAFPLRLDTGSKIARILTQMQIDDLGIDYLQKRNAFIDAVTVEDVNAVAKRLLNSERLQVIVVGEPVRIDQGGS